MRCHSKKWGACCQATIDTLVNVGITYSKTSKVMERCNIEFREDKKFYPKSPLKHDLPPFLDAYPVAVTPMKEYGQANLADLTIELMYSYLHDTITSESAHIRYVTFPCDVSLFSL
jgi:hypothetical protein